MDDGPSVSAFKGLAHSQLDVETKYVRNQAKILHTLGAMMVLFVLLWNVSLPFRRLKGSFRRKSAYRCVAYAMVFLAGFFESDASLTLKTYAVSRGRESSCHMHALLRLLVAISRVPRGLHQTARSRSFTFFKFSGIWRFCYRNKVLPCVSFYFEVPRWCLARRAPTWHAFRSTSRNLRSRRLFACLGLRFHGICLLSSMAANFSKCGDASQI